MKLVYSLAAHVALYGFAFLAFSGGRAIIPVSLPFALNYWAPVAIGFLICLVAALPVWRRQFA